MKKFIPKILLVSLLCFSAISCVRETDDDYSNYGSAFKAQTMKRADFENSIKLSSPKEMKKAGKIYLKDNFMFIGDTNRGFHIYDNTDPNNPTLVNFLEIPGVTDIAIRNNVFYANQAVDLVAFKLDLQTKQLQVLKRVPKTFPEKVSPDGYIQNVGSDEVVVDWN